eukprot:s406_g5.t1
MSWWNCGSRWQRVEWKPDQEINSGTASSGELHGKVDVIQTSSAVAQRLPEDEKVKFRASRKKELDSLVSTGAVKILSLAESLKFMRETPEQVIDSKYVDRYKPIAVSKQKLEGYKTRVTRALQQGHLKAIELEADAASPKSRLCAVGWQENPGEDIKTAFLQALPTMGAKRLACRLPRDECSEGLDPRQLLLLLTEIYGLVSGPSWWRRTLLKVATERLRYVMNCYDRCILTLKMERRIFQLKVSWSFKSHCIAELGVKRGRPDASAAASILAASFPSPTLEHVLAANDVVKHLKTFSVTLRIRAIPEKKLRLLLIADSAFDASGKEKSQHGWLLGFTKDLMNQGKSAPVSLVQWRSKRLRRKALSSLLRKAISMSAATGALERSDAFFQSIGRSKFSPRGRQLTEDQYLEASGKARVIANDSAT